MLCGVRLVTFDINADRRARGPSAGKAEDDAAAAVEQYANALVLRNGTVDRIVIGKVIGGGDLQRAETLARQ
ncbi:hypothetical protein D3C86_1999640 [compost metagenome]